MAKGLRQHQERLDAIALLGKDLARRAGRKCELCEGTGDLRPWDSAPNNEPSLETVALFCGRCRDLMGGVKQDPSELRFLETAMWHELSVVAAAAKSALRTLDEGWARAALELVGE